MPSLLQTLRLRDAHGSGELEDLADAITAAGNRPVPRLSGVRGATAEGRSTSCPTATASDADALLGGGSEDLLVHTGVPNL